MKSNQLFMEIYHPNSFIYQIKKFMAMGVEFLITHLISMDLPIYISKINVNLINNFLTKNFILKINTKRTYHILHAFLNKIRMY